MTEPVNAQARPSRLSPFVHVLTLVLLLAAFLSGSAIWVAQIIQEREQSAPVWLHAVLVIHGGLNPVLSAMFGFLLCQHIRLGWLLKANRRTGLTIELILAGLILTGVGLYYCGPDYRNQFVWLHRILGLLLPLGLTLHLVAAHRWVDSIQK